MEADPLAAQSYDGRVLQGLAKVRDLRPVVLIRAAGLCLFAVAFCLPAIDNAPPIRGYQCAWATLAVPLMSGNAGQTSDLMMAVLLFVSGCASPLILAYFVCVHSQKLATLRRGLAVAGLISLAVAFVFVIASNALFNVYVRPLIGHYFWISGSLLILIPELLQSRQAAA